MKHFKTACFVALHLIIATISSSIGYADTLTIVHHNWEEAREIATNENKLILIDFYTTWCGPCKMFSQKLSADENLKKRIAEHYVMLKYDAEADKKFDLTKKFHVGSYPTYVIVTPGLNVIGKAYGNYLKDDEQRGRFIQFFEKGVRADATEKYIPGYNQSLENEYPAFYVNYVHREKDLSKGDLDSFWNGKHNFFVEQDFALYSYFGGNDRLDSHFLANLDKYVALYGEDNCDYLIRSIVSSRFSKAVKNKNQEDFDQVRSLAEEFLPEELASKFLESWSFRLYLVTKQWAKMEEYVREMAPNLSLDIEVVNYYCWTIYESECKDSNVLSKASEWMKSAMSNHGYSFAALDTYACLLYKNKNFLEAEKYMKLAIELAKENNEDYSSSEKVLKEIQAQLKTNKAGK